MTQVVLMKINNKISETLYLKTIKLQYVYSSIGDSQVVLVFGRNDAGLKKLSQVLSEQTGDSSAFLNTTCLLNYILNSYLIRISDDLLYFQRIFL
jgi:hypothetical protein